MQRRNFVKVMAVASVARGQSIDASSMRELAAVVLPASLGRKRTDKIAADFLRWIAEYKDGVHSSSGYGNPRTQTVPPNPSTRYASQLRALGSPITRAAVEVELASFDRIPNRPNGRHVVADLLAYFYGSAAGEDFLYGAEIRRDDCRGLANSTQRPKRLT